MERVVRPRTGRRPLRRHRGRGRLPDADPDARGPRSFRAAAVALSVSVVSILLAAAAIAFSVSRPADVAPARPVPLLPQTVTVTLLAPPVPATVGAGPTR